MDETKRREPEDCPICQRVGTVYLAAMWVGTGWHGLQVCTACRHWIAPMGADRWWESSVPPWETDTDSAPGGPR